MNYAFNREIFEELNNTPITPENVAYDVVGLLNDTDFWKEPDADTCSITDYIETHRVLDIYCKSASFLVVFYERFMFSLRYVLPNPDDRDYFIWRYLLYAFCPSRAIRDQVCNYCYKNEKYDMSSTFGHINAYNIKDDTGVDATEVRKVVKDLKFDVVCGNPPYNNDMYLDFVQLGHKLSKSYDLWITPAKWQARQYFDNSFNFLRSDLLSCTYYIDCDEIFSSIREWGGIAYYVLSNGDSNLKTIKSVCNRNKNLNKVVIVDNLNYGLHSYAYSVIEKVLSLNFKRYEVNKEVNTPYRLILPNTYSTTSGRLSDDGAYYVLSPLKVYTDLDLLNDNDKILYNSDKEGCDSANLYFSTKFIRFLLHLSLCKQHPLNASLKDNNADTFLFVPDPVSFDRIFEDKPLDGYTPDENGEYIDSDGNKHCSLYIKYKLTDKEIEIIESVIRERK